MLGSLCSTTSLADIEPNEFGVYEIVTISWLFGSMLNEVLSNIKSVSVEDILETIKVDWPLFLIVSCLVTPTFIGISP